MNFDEIIFLDGAMGTMLQARGMKPGENPCVFGADHPDILEHIHRGYFEAGSRIVLSNTFGASVPKMKGSGRSCEEVTFSAVSAAKRVADEFGGLVALDVGPLGELLEPLGSLPFEDAVGFFKTQMTAGANAGADLIFIETMMDLYEAKAALLAAKEATSLPVFVTMTFEENGRTFTGCDVSSAAVCLSSLGADAIGVNCSVGPDKLVSVISEMRKYTTLPIIAKPNAGIPRADGSYDLTAEEFAEHTARLVKAGACVVGGCCGTTPGHIRLLKEKLRGVKSPERPEKVPVGVCSSTRHILLSRPVTVGERLNPTGKKLLKQALTDGDMSYICRQAVAQQEQGAEILDINVGIPGANEEELMKKVVAAVRSVSDLPLQIDSSDPAAIEAGLRLAGGRSIVNSVNGKEESLTAVLPIVKKYGAVVVGLTLDENGIPETSEGRVEIAKKIISRCEEAGIPRADIAIDCLTMTVGVDPENPKITLDALSEVKKLGAKTVLGVSNVSFGLPRRDIVNRTFLAAALNRGLDLAIINPGDEAMIETMFASRLLNGFDAGGAEYIEKFAQSVSEKVPVGSGYSLGSAIERGLCDEAASAMKALLQTENAQNVINSRLIPILDGIGKRYEEGKIYLPQLMRSAEAAKAACDVVRAAIPPSESGTEDAVVLATVHGDIHDIGKNIVRSVLENYGFRIIDLGRDVPEQTVVDAVLKSGAKLCGLSALMTTTVPAMEQTIKLLNEQAPFCRTVVGGAVLTADYAARIGADYYSKDAAATVRAAKEVYGRN